MVPGPLLGPQSWPPICIYWPWSPICVYQPCPPICIYGPCPPICIYQHWIPVCIYQPWPTISLPARDLSLHIPALSPQFVFVFTAMAYDLYYRSGVWISIYLIIIISRALAPNLHLLGLGPNLYLPALASSLYLPALACNIITVPGPEFAFTSLLVAVAVVVVIVVVVISLE